MKNYFSRFNVIELQSTFYNLPKMETAKKWLERARSVNPKFKFNMKAWQAITHSPKSPTWRRSREKPRPGYGSLRPSQDNYEAWIKIHRIARTLDVEVVVLQTPKSFGYSEENLKSIEEFLSTIDRKGVNLGWEPRGNWRLYEDKLKRLFKKLDLIHIVDPFRWRVLSSHSIVYYRLHGIGGKEVNYRYKYNSEDLVTLSKIVCDECSSREECYVMFNNISMVDDSLRFKEIFAGYCGYEVL